MKIVVVTGHVVVGNLPLGVSAILRKPPDVDRLVETIEELGPPAPLLDRGEVGMRHTVGSAEMKVTNPKEDVPGSCIDVAVHDEKRHVAPTWGTMPVDDQLVMASGANA